MSFPKHLIKLTTDIEAVPSSTDMAARLIGMLDHTALGSHVTAEKVIELCQAGVTPYGNIAAVCIPSRFIDHAVATLQGRTIKIAAVVNFPHGDNTAARVAVSIADMINAGAEEIDLVFPYQAFLKGHISQVRSFLKRCNAEITGGVTLKVILETGALSSYQAIRDATFLVLEQGADFIQTSTGNYRTGASLLAVATILEAAGEFHSHLENHTSMAGIKISGGIATVQDATSYLCLAEEMCKTIVTPANFRVGAMRLLKMLTAYLKT